MTDLQQRRALVIGAANGFGRAIAARAAEAGLAVVAADLDLAGVRHWAAEIPTITSLKIDVTSPESVSSGVAQTVELLEGLDVLIYSPGVIFQRSLFEAPLEEWNTTLAVNLTGAFLASQAAANPLRSSLHPTP